MLPNQPVIRLSLSKTVVTALTADNMMNYHGKNGATADYPAANAGVITTTPPDTESCITCNSLVPDGCGTGTAILSW